MSLLDTLRKHLTPDLLQQVQDSLGDSFNYDVVPRSRLNTVIKQRDEYKSQAETTSQSGDGADDFEDESEDGTSGKFKAPVKNPAKGKPVDEAALTAKFAAEKATAINEVKVQYAAMDYLRTPAVGCVDPELAFSLVDKTKLVLGADGKVTGFEDAFKPITESKTFLFTPATGGDKGKSGAGSKRDEIPGGTGKDKQQGDDVDTSALDTALDKVFASAGVDLSNGAE